MSVYMYGAGLCMWVQVHSEARRGRQIPQRGVPSSCLIVGAGYQTLVL